MFVILAGMYMTRKWETPRTALLPEQRLKTCLQTGYALFAE